ncbi:hypothetical protein NDU88_005666 [Pleurodeles waltl]|uniref:Uncharacterized protein n=1 Tax=Pleurodeles waltl TaxID=8319 RepID=A0AAV7NNF6_PLEWA|nr:hypothetical protein NDU88_005666 [Pleurodeles waltl]
MKREASARWKKPKKKMGDSESQDSAQNQQPLAEGECSKARTRRYKSTKPTNMESKKRELLYLEACGIWIVHRKPTQNTSASLPYPSRVKSA